MPFFDIFASPRWSPLRMRTKVVSFFIFPKSFQTKKIKALRPKMTKIASRGSCLKEHCWRCGREEHWASLRGCHETSSMQASLLHPSLEHYLFPGLPSQLPPQQGSIVCKRMPPHFRLIWRKCFELSSTISVLLFSLLFLLLSHLFSSNPIEKGLSLLFAGRC